MPCAADLGEELGFAKPADETVHMPNANMIRSPSLKSPGSRLARRREAKKIPDDTGQTVAQGDLDVVLNDPLATPEHQD